MNVHRSRLRPLLVLSLALALIATACGGDDDDGQATNGGTATTVSSQPFRLGMSVSLTGFNAAVGKELLNGLNVWVDMINNRTGIYAGRKEPGLLGRKVELVTTDDQSNPQTALTIYQRLMTQEKVDLVLPPYGSGSTGVVAPIAERQKYAFIGLAAGSETIYKQGLKYMVMATAPTSRYLAGVPEVIQNAGYGSLYMLTLNNPATVDMASFMNAEAGKRGWKVLGDDKFENGTKDFTASLSKIKQANPDVVVIHAFGVDATTIMRQAKEQQLAPKMFAIASGAWRDDVFVNGVGAANVDCVIGDQHWSKSFTYRGTKEFAEAYEAKFGGIVGSGSGSDASSAWGFNGGQLITQALDKLGPDALKDQLKLVDYLKTAPDLETVLGPIKADPTTGIVTSLTPGVFQFQGGKRVVIGPASMAEGKPQLPCKPLAGR
jgi:branched-chain amino acid transport system substrate-binding protein